MSEPLVLRTALGRHDHVSPLRDGRVSSSRLRLLFIDFEPLPKAFRAMIREDRLDVSEMAVVNQVLAHRFGKPLAALAIPLWSRLPHTNLVCRRSGDVAGAKDLEGKKVGVRAYAQTSGVWVRGVLRPEYGVDLGRIEWVTKEDAHVAEYLDPPSAVRDRSPSSLRALLQDGSVAAIMGEREVDPSGVRTVVDDAEEVARAWTRRVGFSAVNHVLAVRRDLITQHPWLASELMTMFTKARRIAIADGAEPPPAYGRDPNAASLQMLLRFCREQEIIDRDVAIEEIFLDA